MTQDLRARRPIGSAGTQRGSRDGTPGLWPCIVVAILSGVACWFWLVSGATTTTAAQSAAEGVASELAQVDDRDAAAALTTMSGSTEFLTQFKERQGNCLRPVAWVSLTRALGQPATGVRLRSGSYFSPIFNLSDVPVRVAIPYPGPYETGRGTLTVMVTSGDVVVALQPAWRVSARNGQASHEVTWHPRINCKQQPNE